MANETMQWPQAGLGSVGSYQMSGIPYATASLTVPVNSATPLKIVFPYVVKFVTIVNTISGSSAPFRIGFSELGVKGTNYFTINSGESYTGEWRIEDLFLISDTSAQCSASIVAGLTPIPRGVPSFKADGSGNNWSGSVGVG